MSRESQQVNPAAIVRGGPLDWESNERVRQLTSDRWREVNGGSALRPGSVGSGLQDGRFGPEESTQYGTGFVCLFVADLGLLIQLSRLQPHLVQSILEFEASQKQSGGPLVWLIQAQSVDEGQVM